jgi:peptide/nickel transport system substrate-binding protein
MFKLERCRRSLSHLRVLMASFALVFAASFPSWSQSESRRPGTLVWAIHSEPRTFDPAKVDDQTSELVRYLTGGVLVRFNRRTQQSQPELADGWKIAPDGREISFHLRNGLHFSDGTPLTSKDVAWSLHRVLSPQTAAPVAGEFLDPQSVTIETPDAHTIRVHLRRPVVGIANVFDEIAIEPESRPSEARVTAGPFTLSAYNRAQSVQLQRNPYYWKRDAAGRPLPYASGIRLDILSNREQETARFIRGDYDLMDALTPDYFGLLARKDPAEVHDLGPSLNTEQLWFNQASKAPLPQYERSWFQNRDFRIAVSQAIHRADLARIAYDGHATPADGFISPANRLWRNTSLHVPREDRAEAARRLKDAGFNLRGGVLYDASGHPVTFSILTNAGNAAREKMTTLIQQDLGALGMQVRVVTLDFPALIDRLMHKQDYEACLLGLSNVEPDPNESMNVWLSSSPNHQWNPSEPSPATPWEAEIDREMTLQSTTSDFRLRKAAVDRVQQIVADQQPFIYLVYPNALYAASPRLRGIAPAILQPGLVWNIEQIQLSADHR